MFKGWPSPRNRKVNILFLLLGLIHLAIPLYNHFVFRSYAYDYAVYNYAFHDYAHLRITPCPIYQAYPPVSFWQDHFSLLLPLLSPLYWVLTPVTGTYTLIILQWLFVMMGGACTYWFIARRSKGELLPLLAAAMYFLMHGRFSAHRADVNIAIMAASLVPVVIELFDRRNWKLFFSVSALLLISREDMSLWLLFVGLFLALLYRHDRRSRRMALILAGVSVSYFILSMSVLIPVFLETAEKKFTLFEYGALGDSPVEALVYLFHDPLQVLKLLFINHGDSETYNGLKGDFYMLYLLSGGLFLLIRPWFILPLLPLVAKKMLNDNPVRWGIEHYYAIEFVSLMPLLIFLAISTLDKPLYRRLSAGAALIAAASCTVWALTSPPTTLLLLDFQKFNVFDKEFYSSGYSGEIRKVLRLIPPEAPVCASGKLTPHLAYRDRIRMFPLFKDASYVVAQLQNDHYPKSVEEFNAHVESLYRDSAHWSLLYGSPRLVLFKARNAR